VTEVEVVDPHTIRLRTANVYPLLPVDLTQVAIISHRIGPDPATEDFNSGKDAIGTGPFRFVSYRPGDRIELARNDGWWGGTPAWEHVSYRIITNDQSRDGPTPFVTGPNGETLDRNPLKDRRVREALSLAINRGAIVERVMEGAAVPSGQFLAPGSYSYVPDLAAPPFDAERARRLLAEAGYPNGLRITLHGPNDRYVNDAKIIQAVGQMWSRVGVRTTVDALPWTSFIGHANRQEYSAFLLGWGSATGEASNPLRALVATWDAAKGYGAANRGRYVNPALDALLGQAMRTADDAAREQKLEQATRMAMDDVALIPLHMQKSIWAMRAGLRYTARADEETRAWDLRPAP
jgi:peptide/nickel transport system substrate-binding protein